jgi:hypothetical protein
VNQGRIAEVKDGSKFGMTLPLELIQGELESGLELNCSPSLDQAAGLFPASSVSAGRVPLTDRSARSGLCCRSRCVVSLRQASHFRRASSRLMNQCAFKHSARDLPLNDSMNAELRAVQASRYRGIRSRALLRGYTRLSDCARPQLRVCHPDLA